MRGLRRRWWLAAGGAVVLAGAGTGVWWFVVRDDDAGAGGPTSTTQAVAASLTTLEKTVTASGTVAPVVHEEVSFAAGGTVTAVPVAPGQTVVAGQTLATIDTLSLNASLLAAKATLAEAQARLADAEDVDDGGEVAQAQIDAAAAQVDVAQAAVDDAADAMADATLVAPAAGLVTEVNLEVGDVVGSGGTGSAGSTGSAGGSAAQPGATTTTASTSSSADVVIVGTDAWTVGVTVDDSEVALIQVGDQAELTLDEAPDTVFGVVSEVGLVPSSTSGVPAYPVTIAITGQPAGVYDGVDADASIVYERRTDVLTVPSAAVRTVDGASTVTMASDDGGQESVPVTVGETVGDKTEIVDGLAEGDEVLVTVVTQAGDGNRSGQGNQSNQGGQGFDPSQMQLPPGFDPSQMGDGTFPGRPGQDSSDG